MRFVDNIARPIVLVPMCGKKCDFLLDYMIFRQHIILKLPKSWLVQNHQDLHGQNSKGPYNITPCDSIGLYHLCCIALMYAVFQFCFIDIISDKGNYVWSFNLLAYMAKKLFSTKCRFSRRQNAGHTKSWIFRTWSMYTYKTVSNLKGIK